MLTLVCLPRGPGKRLYIHVPACANSPCFVLPDEVTDFFFMHNFKTNHPRYNMKRWWRFCYIIGIIPGSWEAENATKSKVHGGLLWETCTRLWRHDWNGGRGRSVQTCERYIILSHGVPKPLFTCISMSTYVKVGDNNINKRNVQMY